MLAPVAHPEGISVMSKRTGVKARQARYEAFLAEQRQKNNTGGCGPCGGEFCPDGTCGTCQAAGGQS